MIGKRARVNNSRHIPVHAIANRSNVPRYDFSWQTMYYFKRHVAIPKGTRLMLTAHFDNSGRNKYNPDPKQAVRWGDPTYDEMMMAFFEYTMDAQSLESASANKPGPAPQK